MRGTAAHLGPVVLDIGDPEQARSSWEGKWLGGYRRGGYRLERPLGIAHDRGFDRFGTHPHRAARGSGLACAQQRFLGPELEIAPRAVRSVSHEKQKPRAKRGFKERWAQRFAGGA